MINAESETRIFSIKCEELIYTIVAQQPNLVFRFDQLLDREIAVLYGQRESLVPDDRSAVESALFQERFHRIAHGRPPQLDDGLFEILITRANRWLTQDFLDLEAAEDNRLPEDIEVSADECDQLDDPPSPTNSITSPRYSFSSESTAVERHAVWLVERTTEHHPADPEIIELSSNEEI